MDGSLIPPIDDDEEQFLIDLKNTYDKHYDEEKGAYHLYRIQMEMDEKYPDAQYTYMYIFKNVETIEGQKDMYLPMMHQIQILQEWWKVCRMPFMRRDMRKSAKPIPLIDNYRHRNPLYPPFRSI